MEMKEYGKNKPNFRKCENIYIDGKKIHCDDEIAMWVMAANNEMGLCVHGFWHVYYRRTTFKLE